MRLVALVLAGCSFTPGVQATSPSSDAPGGGGGGGGADAPGITDAPSVQGKDSPPPPPGPMFVQGAGTGANPWNTGADSISTKFSTNVAAGDVIAVYVTFASGATLSRVNDTLGNTYTLVDSVSDGVNQQIGASAYAIATSSGADTVTATLSGSRCCRAIVVHEIANLDAMSPLDAHAAQHQGGLGTTPDQVSSGAATTTSSGDYIFAATSDAKNVSGQMISAGTGETARESPTIPNGNPTMSEDQIQASAGAISSTFTFSASNGSALTVELAFRP